MSDAQSKIDALEAILGVDDTAEVERPELRKGVGEILGGAAGSSVDAATEPPAAEPTAPPEPATPPRTVRQQITPAPHKPAPRQAASSPKRKTSSLLPAEFSPRLDAAKARRWGFAELVASALDHLSGGEAAADPVLDDYKDSVRSLRSYTLDSAVLDRLDAVGEGWRMNRSQALTVLIANELDRLGF